jgi:membrane-associated phospholipid phosphatase
MWAGLALLSAEMLVVLLLCFLAVIAFAYVARRVFIVGNLNLDHKMFDFLANYVTPTNNSIMKFITFFGTHEFLIPANLVLIAFFLFIKKHKWYSIKVPAIALSSLAMMFFLKNFFGRERPVIPLLEEAAGLSFPSGHALISTTFYGLLIYIAWHTERLRAWKWPITILLIIWILLWLVISIRVIRGMEKYSRRKINPVVEQPAVATVEVK